MELLTTVIENVNFSSDKIIDFIFYDDVFFDARLISFKIDAKNHIVRNKTYIEIDLSSK